MYSHTKKSHFGFTNKDDKEALHDTNESERQVNSREIQIAEPIDYCSSWRVKFYIYKEITRPRCKGKNFFLKKQYFKNFLELLLKDGDLL